MQLYMLNWLFGVLIINVNQTILANTRLIQDFVALSDGTVFASFNATSFAFISDNLHG